jgi:hypothetical protein
MPTRTDLLLPWVTQVKTFEALRRLGWQADYITWAHIEAEGELARLRMADFSSSAPIPCKTACRSRADRRRGQAGQVDIRPSN